MTFSAAYRRRSWPHIDRATMTVYAYVCGNPEWRRERAPDHHSRMQRTPETP